MNFVDSKIIRLLNVAGVAAVGHLLSVILVPYAANKFGSEVASDIAIVDSSIMLLSTILAFGLSLTVTRDVSKVSNWKDVINECLSARISLSLIVIICSSFLYFTNFINFVSFLCFLSAPLIALNLDFTLYGRDKPVRAAYASFIRMTLPIIAFFIVPYVLNYELNYLYVVLVFYAFSTAFVFYSLNLIPKIKFDIAAVKLYKPVMYVGLGSLCIIFQRFGFLTFFNADDKSIFMLSSMLKIYLAFVAIRRLFIQTFYISLLDRAVYKKVEIFCIIVGASISISFFSFSGFFAEFIFSSDEEYARNFIVYAGILIASGSLFATADARLFLKNKDSMYYLSAFIAIAVWLISMLVIFLFNLQPQNVLIALAISEFTLALAYKFYLVRK